jgi:lysophospholipase L1-like esterase
MADPQELAAAVSDTLVRLRSEADPDTEIVVLGASNTPGTSTTLIERINTLLDAAAEDAGLHFVDVAAENWTDPADPGLWADPVHPNDDGYERIADRLAPVLADVLGS